MSLLNAYERTPLKTGFTTLFLYALHLDEANSLQIGFGMETSNELQRAHITGPQVHALHLDAFIDWLANLDPFNGLRLVEAIPGKRHPLSSAGQTASEYRAMLATVPTLELAVGRYLPAAAAITAVDRLLAFSQAVDAARISAFGHPLTWETQHVELKDGRFAWFAYDDEIDKIRLGMGYHDAGNDKQYGAHTYALGLREVLPFAEALKATEDEVLPFMALPPRWPIELPQGLYGPGRGDLALALVRWADKVWPGKIEALVEEGMEGLDDPA